jgi:hypothetical protein
MAGGHSHLTEKAPDWEIHIFDPATNLVTRVGEMAIRRWYPTCTTLDDGRALIVGGYANGVPLLLEMDIFAGIAPTDGDTWLDGGPKNETYEIFDPQGTHLERGKFLDSSQQTLYPFVKLLPGGALFVHNRHVTRLFFKNQANPRLDPLGRTDSGRRYRNVLSKNFRTYPGQGACVLLPLISTEQGARVLIVGGANEAAQGVNRDSPATNTAEVFTFASERSPSEDQPGWRGIDAMAYRRFMSDAVLLPDESVLVTGGSTHGVADENHGPVMTAERLDTRTLTWSTMATQTVPRRYHSVALLLPDGRVLTAGSTGSFVHSIPNRKASLDLEYRLEVYEPPYLFKGHRPKIVAAPESISYATTMDIDYEGTSSLSSIVFIRPGAVTHTNDMDQRCVRLWIEADKAGRVTVRTPIDGTWAPPGWYLLFVLDGDRVPSIARFVHLA